MENKQYKFKGIIEKCIYDTPDFKIYAVTVDKKQYPELKQNKYNNNNTKIKNKQIEFKIKN